MFPNSSSSDVCQEEEMHTFRMREHDFKSSGISKLRSPGQTSDK